MGQAVDLAQFPDTDFAALAEAAGCRGLEARSVAGSRGRARLARGTPTARWCSTRRSTPTSARNGSRRPSAATRGERMPCSPISSTALASGDVRVVDLTQPLSERTPVLQLPEPFANTPGLSRRELSRYDDRGPAWAWDVLEIGEHVGTHFDAPIHWITGRDGEDVASVPPARLVGPAVVIDKSAEAAEDPDYLLTRRRHPRLRGRARRAARGRLAAAAHGLGLRAPRPGRVPQRRPHARPRRRVRALAGRGGPDRRLRRRDRRHRRGHRAQLRPAVPGPPLPARRGQVRDHPARQPRRAAADRAR